ncbi:MAG: LVIVD repeat-containing protein [Novosphingobium sp.]
MKSLILKLSAIALAASTAPPLLGATPDRPEPGKQGETIEGEDKVLAQPYSKGVNIIGHSDINKRSGNIIMTWAGNCAYVAGGLRMTPAGPAPIDINDPNSGIAVIDASNPAAPKFVRYLKEKGALEAGETTHAVVAKDRAVLAASVYAGVSGMGPAKQGWLAVYDVSNCANPKLMSEVKWPEAVHTLTVSPNGKRIYGTIISPFTGNGGIQVMDISDLRHPRFVGKFAATRPDGSSFEFAPHELSISPDEKRLYVGVIASKGDDLNKGVKIFPPNADGLGPEAGGIYIMNSSEIAAGKQDAKLRLVGTSLHGGWHGAVQARIGGKPYLVGAGELGACPGAWPRISDISDEKNAHVVGQFRLAMNRKENCPERNTIEKASGGVVGRSGVAASHFNDVDNAANTRLGLFGMMYAGLRIADLRDPANPTEIAYYKPGDACMSHVRYVPKTGHIWFACMDSGFHIVEVKPELRKALKLPK